MTLSLNDWLQHFETLHPVGIDMGLARVADVWQRLCQQFGINRLARRKVITVAGTNGKGSACQMLSLLLSAQGYRVGLYTSPHIHRFNERVKINDREADDAELVRAFAAIEAARGDTTLSYFEATTLAGLLVFAWQQLDFAVLEVGLGGRLDAINIIDADAALITSIALDHEAFLGSDLSQIALEKAGICRPHHPAVYAQTGVYDSVLNFVEHHHIALLANGRDYNINGTQIVWGRRVLTGPDNIAELGPQQISNCAGVLLLLAQLDLLPDDYATPLAGFALAGRLQRLATQPDIILDVAHNEAAALALAAFIRRQQGSYPRTFAVIGMLADKDHAAVLQAFDGLFDAVFCAPTWGERGLSAQDLAAVAKHTLACPVHVHTSLKQALKVAQQQANPADLIIAFGSFLVAQALT